MADCIFCSIINKQISADIIYEDRDLIVIRDIKPIAKHHYLFIPTAHYANLAEMTVFNANCLAGIMKKIPEIVETLGITNGYRLVVNQGADAGQTVQHFHIHLLAGQKMSFTV